MGEMPGDDGTGDTKGWDRASIAYRSRKPYFPDIGAKDLRLPNEAGKLRTLGMCAVCAVCMTLLYLAVPLYGVSLFFFDLGAWLPGGLLAAMPVLTVLLFVFSVYETSDLRRLAKEL
jgi:hypothetical protein